MKKVLLAMVLCVAGTAAAQAPAPPAKPLSSCPECGVVRTVRMIEKESKPAPVDNTKPSGLVATIPLGRNADPPKIGSSQQIGKEAVRVNTRWEVTVRLDDGRFRVVMVDEQPEVREGDKVRIEEGKLVRRD